MAGTLFGIARSQWFDPRTSRVASGARLSIFAANSSTPATVYKDSGLTAGQEHTFPILADSYGIIPAFWVADGSYRSRLTTSDAAITLFDDANLLAIGPSSGEGGAGESVDANALLQTGDPIWRLRTGVMTGFVRMNGRTIGNASSGGSERANSDTEDLFTYYWNNFSNTLAPVSSGRGASAAADYAANKTITLLNMQGRGPFGLDDMGATAANAFSGLTFDAGDATTAGSKLGANSVTLSQSEIPIITPAGSISSVVSGATFGGTGQNQVASGAGLDVPRPTSSIIVTSTFAGTPFGGGAAHTNTPRAMLGTWYQKL